MTLPGK